MKKETKCNLHFLEYIKCLVLEPNGELYLRGIFPSLYSDMTLYNAREEDGFYIFDVFTSYEHNCSLLFDIEEYDNTRKIWTRLDITEHELEADKYWEEEYK